MHSYTHLCSCMSKNTKPLYTLIDEETNIEIRRRVTKNRKINTVIAEAIAATKANYPTTAPLEVSSEGDSLVTGKGKRTKTKPKKPRTAAQIGKAIAKLSKPKAKKPAKKSAKKKSTPKVKVAKTSK